MKKIALLFLPVLAFFSCQAQTDKKTQNSPKIGEISKVEPKIDYQVKKEYDENGNLIRLDSTYTYYYTNVDKNAILNDRIFNKLNQHFKMNSPFEYPFFEEYFNQNQNLEDSFFSEDFFSNNLNNNQELIRQMITRMDSIKNQFLLETYPLQPKVEEEKENQ